MTIEKVLEKYLARFLKNPDYEKTSFIHLWGDNWRVNVWMFRANPKIVASYFVKFSDKAGLISSIPNLEEIRLIGAGL